MIHATGESAEDGRLNGRGNGEGDWGESRERLTERNEWSGGGEGVRERQAIPITTTFPVRLNCRVDMYVCGDKNE